MNSPPPNQGYRVCAPDVSDAGIARIQDLLDRYPYKSAQRLAQGISRERLLEFHRSRLASRLASDQPTWVVERGGDLVALGGLEDDSWHSEIYGIKMGKISPWLNVIEPEAGVALMDAVLKGAAAERFNHLSVRLDGEDFVNLHAFENAGFRLIDVSLKFTRPLPYEGDAANVSDGGWKLRPARAEDSQWMRELGGGHAATHFLNDPGLPAQRTRKLFAAWVERCAQGLAYRIYVLEDVQGRRCGFVIYLRNARFARAVGRRPLILDYVLLPPEMRGRGLGPWLIEESLRQEGSGDFDFCELRTSQHNYPAIACYEKLGFRLCATDFVLHRTL